MYIKCKDGILDPDLYFLKDILIMLDAKLLELDYQIQEARKNSRDPDALGLFDKGEYIIRMGFAACQKYMTSTFGPIVDKKNAILKKETALKIGPKHENAQHIATIINDAANYWKHYDEWKYISFVREPDSDMAKVIIRDFNCLTNHQKKIITRIETVTPWADYICSNILASLIKTSELRLLLLATFLEDWWNQLDNFISNHDSDYYV